MNNSFKDLAGQTVAGLTALQYLGNQRYLCRCNKCGKVYTLTASAFKNGINACRECTDKAQSGAKTNLQGMTIGQTYVDHYIGSSLWECRCSCGKIMRVKTFNLTNAIKNGKSYSCPECSAEKKRDKLEGKIINDWEIQAYLGNGMYKCKCKCGSIHEVRGKSIKSGESKSCRKCGGEKLLNTRLEKYGTTTFNVKNERTKEQIEAVLNRDNLSEFIQKNFKYAPKVYEVAALLGISECITLRIIHKFKLEDYINIGNGSAGENEVYSYITSIYSGRVALHHRGILREGKELDIYIPDKKLAIEFNGVYWHSDIFKDKNYHKSKTIQCLKSGIRLIHIFEDEWYNADKRQKIQSIIKSALGIYEHKLGARECIIRSIEFSTAKEFLDKYHLQGGGATSSVNIGCYKDDTLLGVMTLGDPRFDTNFDWEIIRECWLPDTLVIGGASKMFEYFKRNYNPLSVISYCDATKFTGSVYFNLGFKLDTVNPMTEPNYVWIKASISNGFETLPRYQTQKKKLIARGLGVETQTETEIMENLGFVRVYNSGNLRFVWTKNN